jgi:hypothetical protein
MVISAPASQPATATNADASLSSIELKSSPYGADITVDDKYVGTTPSTLKLAAGDHKIKLEKNGFKTWEKTLTVSAGASVTSTTASTRNGCLLPESAIPLSCRPD